LDAVLGLGLGLGLVVVLGAGAVISCRCGWWGRCGVSSHPQSVASIHSAACFILYCSITASHKDVDDASLWWWRLYDVTANRSAS